MRPRPATVVRGRVTSEASPVHTAALPMPRAPSMHHAGLHAQHSQYGGTMVKTVIGSFDSYDEAQRVVRDLKDQGFMENDVSIVASNVGGRYESARALDRDNANDV